MELSADHAARSHLEFSDPGTAHVRGSYVSSRMPRVWPVRECPEPSTFQG